MSLSDVWHKTYNLWFGVSEWYFLAKRSGWVVRTGSGGYDAVSQC